MANVYYVSTTGNNANNGLTQATAFATLTYALSIWNALAAANQGGVVIFVIPAPTTRHNATRSRRPPPAAMAY